MGKVIDKLAKLLKLTNNNDKPGAKVILNALLLSVNFVIVISRSPLVNALPMKYL